MTVIPDEIASLRLALADAERARDAAIERIDTLTSLHRRDRSETQHRLRNTVSVIRAIVHRTADETDDVLDYVGLLEGRLAAYLNVQVAVAASPARGIDLELLILDELLRFGITQEDRFEITGPPLELNNRAAGLIALMVYDLVSQMIINGFEWSTTHLSVVWAAAEADDPIVVDWSISGGGVDSGEPVAWRETLHAAIQHQLSGQISVHNAEGRKSTRFVLPRGTSIAATDRR